LEIELKSLAGTVKVMISRPRRQQNLHWKRGRFYEKQMLEHIWQKYSGGTFVDCGACIGNHTLFFAAFCKADKIIAIEPDVENAKHIAVNVQLNGFENVDIINAAVGNYMGNGKLERFGPGEGHQKLVEGNTVNVITLDSLGLTNVTLIKLDVEWSELPALKGAQYLLSEQSPVLFVEANTSEEQLVIKKYLKRFGYKHINTFNDSPTLEFIK
jgi:FkbM family methyltransferase